MLSVIDDNTAGDEKIDDKLVFDSPNGSLDTTVLSAATTDSRSGVDILNAGSETGTEVGVSTKTTVVTSKIFDSSSSLVSSSN